MEINTLIKCRHANKSLAKKLLCRLIAIAFLSVVPLTIYARPDTLCGKWVECDRSCTLYDPYWEEDVTFEWNGNIKNGKADGYGTAVKYIDGQLESTYYGQYVAGIRSGKGTCTVMLPKN